MKEKGQTRAALAPAHWKMIVRVHAAGHNAGSLPKEYRGLEVRRSVEQFASGEYSVNGVEVYQR